ncbi:hypothetical protein J4730_22670 [Klebsiella pneumoniae]|uniref:Uncharacterized protein n=1 Tax=Klebsiella pneumoniae TaxID=573 RepID=A0A939NIZ3_KLEPN|nr:hypothetical protein [Klebsiella pneumoniae]
MTVAPSRAMLSARMPPPQPTSRTFYRTGRRAFGNIAQPQRVDAVERFELALRSHQREATASNLAISA